MIVTGAGRGIGRAIAMLFADHGASVIVATRTAHHGHAVVNEIQQLGGRAHLVSTELGSEAEVNRIVSECLALTGSLDVIVHNAAFIPNSPIEQLTDADVEKCFTINVKAGIWFAKASIPAMRARGGGRLLYTSSVTAQRAYRGCSAYSASKAALNGFIRAAALELGPHQITVNGVEPGIIRTDALEKHRLTPEDIEDIESYIPLGRFGEPIDVAQAMLFLASDAARYITGHTIVVDGGTILPENGAFMQG